MSTIPASSLPPLLPQEMASILGSSSAVEALGGTGGSPTAGAYLDLSPDALQMTAGERVAMVGLEDDAAMFGGSVPEDMFSLAESPAASAALAYDPAQDPANPSYAG
jgi:hypothetical protein